jgi:hypothetical protein
VSAGTDAFCLAAASPEGIIWLIIVFIWGVAQMINQAKGKGRRGRSPSPLSEDQPPSTHMDEQLRELLETMTGTNLDVPPQAPPPPPVQRRVVPAPGEARIHPAYRRKVEVHTTSGGQRAARPMRTPPALPIEEALPTSEAGAPPVSPQRTRTAVEYGMVIPNVVVPVRAMDMPQGMRLSLSTPSLGREAGAEPPELENIDDIRRGLLYAIILGPCKAFEPPHRSLI